jgi:hypothetical protein
MTVEFYRIILRKIHKFHVMVSAVSCDGLHSLSYGFVDYFATERLYDVTLSSQTITWLSHCSTSSTLTLERTIN